MKPVDAIIVARTGSTRVPGKALYEVLGRPLLYYVIERVQACKHIRRVCLATTELAADDEIAALAHRQNISVYRGDPEKVLDRVYNAALQLESEAIIEIGGDCPFIDPNILDHAIEQYRKLGCHYLNNYNPPTFPEGMDINVLSVHALGIAYEQALAPSHRIHPFSYLADNPQDFKIENIVWKKNLSSYHWSFDFPEDFTFIKCVYERLYEINPVFGIDMLLDLIEKDELIRALNEKLRTPPVEHAFWNSPGIIRDLNNDVIFLAERAKQALEREDYGIAKRCFDQIIKFTTELSRYTQSKV